MTRIAAPALLAALLSISAPALSEEPGGQARGWASAAGEWRAHGTRFEAELGTGSRRRSEQGVVCTVRRDFDGGSLTLFQRRVDAVSPRSGAEARTERGMVYAPHQGQGGKAAPATLVLRSGATSDALLVTRGMWTDGAGVGGVFERSDEARVASFLLANEHATPSFLVARGNVSPNHSPARARAVRVEATIPLDGVRVALDMLAGCSRALPPHED